MSQSAELILQRSVDVLQMFADTLGSLRRIALAHAPQFRSAGFTNLFQMFVAEFDEDYLDTLHEHLRKLRFRDGVLISARLGAAGRGTGYVLRHPHGRPGRRQRRSISSRDGYSYRIADGDDTGARALAELADLGINRVANLLARANDRLVGFISMLRYELGFYIGCLNLEERLAGEPTCLPTPEPVGRQMLSCHGLYDVCLRLTAPSQQMVGNDLNADDTSLILLTGANQGGKSTFLRAVGLAHLMMQCGMFVPAESMRATVCSGMFTHFRREEDPTMNRGKLEDELARMSGIADLVTSGGLVLFNESFAATNEREGSQLARQIIRGLIDRHVKVVLVTHLFDLAHSLYKAKLDNALFLRADRRPDAQRTFKLLPGEPLPTSYGQDLYQRIFEPPAQPIAPARRPLEILSAGNVSHEDAGSRTPRPR